MIAYIVTTYKFDLFINLSTVQRTEPFAVCDDLSVASKLKPY